jgi:D-glycero-D-manno-heptose 1,7-bisphosphate phosphatase
MQAIMNISKGEGWTLFLDRDGVINKEQEGTYVTRWEEFEFLPGVLDGLANIRPYFDKIIIVTNQRGVGKGIMSVETLKDIHAKMRTCFEEAGVQIDKVYSAIALASDDANRKPNTGMALQAKEDFDSIDFKKSVMVGNNLSDMEFGKRMGMKTVFLTTTKGKMPLPHELIDMQCDSLQEWCNCIDNQVLELG